ncbi:hypothetical protein K439DRAFT_246070 [Ramaria rubella]|nr:hypothetical protein K439DRAFT_246070 [Ramaria rubella]
MSMDRSPWTWHQAPTLEPPTPIPTTPHHLPTAPRDTHPHWYTVPHDDTVDSRVGIDTFATQLARTLLISTERISSMRLKGVHFSLTPSVQITVHLCCVLERLHCCSQVSFSHLCGELY